MVAATIQVREGERAEEDSRLVLVWLLVLILLTFAMVLVGGATRLTESGLSITEWNLVTGIMPPLSERAWQAELQLYRQSPQYALLNRGISIEEFRTIYWWEWAHRELGRFIGLVYFAGFAWIALRRAVSFRRLASLAAIGLLLATQGAVGWIMVASGLQPGMTAVEPVRLTLHLTLACLFFAALVATFTRFGGARREPASAATTCWASLLIVLAFVQIALGGLVAGYDAGLAYNTWPLMDGNFAPPGLLLLEPVWRNVVENAATIQFNHRIGAYVLLAAILAYAVVTRGSSRSVRDRGLLAAVLALAQVGIGVATLINAVPIWLALTHQGFALILLLVLVWSASVLRAAPRT